jgi:rhodanese-related sulfurtransferase
MKHISVQAFKEVINSEKHNSSVDFINVCTPSEYKEKHIRGVRSVPLDVLESHMSEFANKSTIYVHCRSGKRGQTAIDKLKSLGVKAELINVEGGILAWEEAGHETGSHRAPRIPIMRQVFLTAGIFVFVGIFLTFFVSDYFAFIPLAVGMGLMFSGLTGWCGMAQLLSRMRWNN